MKIWQLVLLGLVAAAAIVLYVIAVENVITRLQAVPQSNVTPLEVGTSDKQVTIDGTELQGDNYYAR